MIDSKSLFQEKAQEMESVTPAYKTIKETGPDHDKRFMVGVYLGKELVASGEGESNKMLSKKLLEKVLKRGDGNILKPCALGSTQGSGCFLLSRSCDLLRLLWRNGDRWESCPF